LPEADLALLTDAAREAGDIALGFWKRSPRVWDKGEQGPVTEADIAVNDRLMAVLRGARPGYGWLSEESADDAARLDCEHLFIIDPIDGTRAFIQGETCFSHSLAVARRGQLVAAVVFVPALDKLYAATIDGAATCNGAVLRCSDRAGVDGATLLTSKANLVADRWGGVVPPVKRVFRASIAYRMALVAEGVFDGMLTLRPTWHWDVAAGGLIAMRAGAAVTDRLGQPVQFNTPDPRSDGMLCAAPLLHADLSARQNAQGHPKVAL